MTIPSSTNCRRGDVVLVNVRFTDQSGVKARPAIVVSVDSYHESRSDAIVVPLTTSLEAPRFGDHVLSDWKDAGLPRESLAKAVPATVQRSTFRRTFGTVSAEDMARIEAGLCAVLGIPTD